jgi:hypothetical protein
MVLEMRVDCIHSKLVWIDRHWCLGRDYGTDGVVSHLAQHYTARSHPVWSVPYVNNHYGIEYDTLSHWERL